MQQPISRKQSGFYDGDASMRPWNIAIGVLGGICVALIFTLLALMHPSMRGRMSQRLTPQPKIEQPHYSKSKLREIVKVACGQFNVPYELAWAIIAVESDFETRTRSRIGEMGLMQLMPATARAMNVKDPYDPTDNIFGGVRYLSNLLRQFNGDRKLALAAYDAGPQIVKKFGSIPPYSETREYVKEVLKEYAQERAKQVGSPA